MFTWSRVVRQWRAIHRRIVMVRTAISSTGAAGWGSAMTAWKNCMCRWIWLRQIFVNIVPKYQRSINKEQYTHKKFHRNDVRSKALFLNRRYNIDKLLPPLQKLKNGKWSMSPRRVFRRSAHLIYFQVKPCITCRTWGGWSWTGKSCHRTTWMLSVRSL